MSNKITLFGFDVPGPKFKQQETVWAYFDPRGIYSETELPVLECIVQTCSIEAESKYGKEPEPSYKYELEVTGTLDPFITKHEDQVFASKEEAAAYALEVIEDQATALKEKSDRYQQYLQALKSAVEMQA